MDELNTIRKISARGLVAAAVLAAILTVCALAGTGAVQAHAGASKVFALSEASVSGNTINSGDFLISGKVYARDGKAVFDESCDRTAKLIAAAKMSNLKEYGMKDIFEFTATLTFAKFAEGGKVALCFGLDSLRGGSGTKNSFDVVFSYDEGICYTVCEYTESGETKEIKSKSVLSSTVFNMPVAVYVRVDVDGNLFLQIGGNPVISGRKLEVDASGVCGIVSYEKNVFTAEDLSLTGYKYDAPENVDYLETFENGGYNSNVFYSAADAAPLSPSRLSVNGEGELAFCNTASAYISTRYEYSNFELEFDLTDLSRKAEFEGATPVKLISTWFGIAYGVDSHNQITAETTHYAKWLAFEGHTGGTDATKPSTARRYVMYDVGTATTFNSVKVQGMTENDGIDIWNDDVVNGRTINIRFRVRDGVASLFCKYDDAPDFPTNPCFTYDFGVTPTGYVRIFTWGETSVDSRGVAFNSVANFTIDNLSIKNLDYDTVKNVLAAPEYKSNVTDRTPDYVYTSTTDANDLLQNKIGRDDTKKSLGTGGIVAIVLSCVAVVAAAAVLCAVLMRRKAKHEK